MNAETVIPRPDDLAQRIKAEHAAVTKAQKDVVGHAIAAGDYLNQAKVNAGHGGWLKWFDQYCARDLSLKTAECYMKLADGKKVLEEKIKFDTLTNLTLTEAMKLFEEQPDKDEDKDKSANKDKPNTPGTTKASEAYDRTQTTLIKKLQSLAIDQAEAAMKETTRKLQEAFSVMLLKERSKAEPEKKAA
jgi:Protein of unknown function (DUF3102)